MSQEQRLIYVGMHDGVCSLSKAGLGRRVRFLPILGLLRSLRESFVVENQ